MAFDNMRQSDISQRDKQEIKEIIETHCEDLFKTTFRQNNQQEAVLNQSLVTIIALARQKGTPIFTHFVDVWHRFLIEHWRNNHSLPNFKQLVSNKFCQDYKLMQNLKQTSPDLHQQFSHLISTFTARVFSFPEISGNVYLYKDDMEEYIEITKSLNTILRRMVCIILCVMCFLFIVICIQIRLLLFLF